MAPPKSHRAFAPRVDPPYVQPSPPAVPVAVAGPVPAAKPAKARSDPADRSTWPKLARVVAWLRSDADKGVGDTLSRTLEWFGAKTMAEMYTRITKTDCGCADWQARLNEMFPYG